ncbi:CHAT domain-containing protein [Komarekiella sp. 'clone 1']|uniref:CHAT domain-containing protein n=1 Tax=Komarekiella delphini-convector SJRDD-AB1 TaxID=2593771 RepID=A0AA40SZ43_9NOST|nr:CHAT domain-containing protein [Komarekiella delphini-convector]MBD6617662.1 CHAT domain-containing protein [Komarekiella delphini-convector SJRDD-AB1]
MGWLAVLKIINGSFEQGFDINLQTFEDNRHLLADKDARLPANPEIEDLYRSWYEVFRDLRGRYQNPRQRQSDTDNIWQFESLPTHRSTDEGASACRLFFERLEERMRDWLQNSSRGWREIRETLVVLLANTPDEVRVIIKTDNRTLWKLPWHVWDLIERNPNVEIAFSPLGTETPEVTQTNYNNQVRILAVLGDSDDIDIEQDEYEIKRLRDTDPKFLLQPSPQEIIQKLHREEGWDIFFFAGHSETQGERGRIYINESQYLEIRNFRHALQEAVRRGLKLAIFNSCDGLGLAQLLLTSSHIPVVIVMRESVPDQVAQLFLRVFLQNFANGQSLYTSVRQARIRLEEFQEIPGATWLPVIFQNPYAVPPTWEEMRDKINRPVSQFSPINSTQHTRSRWRTWLLVAIVAAVLAITLLPQILPSPLRDVDLQDGDVISLLCLGHEGGPSFLDGVTTDGDVTLVDSIPNHRGTKWKLDVIDWSKGVIKLENQGVNKGRYLARIGDKNVELVASLPHQHSGTAWRIDVNEQGTIGLENFEPKQSSGWLNCFTHKLDVNVASHRDWPNTGTKWKVIKW